MNLPPQVMAALRPRPSISMVAPPQAAPRASFSGSSFDGALNNPSRSSTGAMSIDSSREINESDRRALVIKSRAVRNNLDFVRGMNNTIVELAIGWGLIPMPGSGNKAFDRRALAYFKRWANSKNSDVRKKSTQMGRQLITCREMITDGEIFQLKARDSQGKAVRQFFKTEQIRGSESTEAPAGMYWENGILYDAGEAAQKYRIAIKKKAGFTGSSDFVVRDASFMMHIYEEERALQNRGLPWGYTGLNCAIDVLDEKALEKSKHKINSAIIGSMETPTGKLPASMNALISGTAPAPEETEKDAPRFLNINGSMIPLFKLGEKMNFHPGNQNSINVTEFMSWLLQGYAVGMGCPFELVWNIASKGSASVRSSLELGGRFFERVQRIMIDTMCQPDWEDVIGLGILAYLYPRDYPFVEPLEPPPGMTGWDVVTWRGPRNISIDKMKDGRSAMEQMRAGVMTLEEWWTLNGEDPTEMNEKSENEVVERLASWKEKGLPEEMFWRRMFGPGYSPSNVPAVTE